MGCILMITLAVVGYAQISDNLSIQGSVETSPSEYDIYISNVSPVQNGVVSVNGYVSTILKTSTTGGGNGTFTVTVTNRSKDTYVFERIVDGSELGIDEIYSGGGISYSLNGIQFLSEVKPGQSLTFDVTLTVDRGVESDNVYTYFKFILKTGEEILPGGETTDAPKPEVTETEASTPDQTETEKPVVTEPEEETETEENVLYDDMLGLAKALRSQATNCLNNNNVIWNAIQTTITKNRPQGALPILHCEVPSIKGGNMMGITTSANDTLLSGNIVHYIFMADETDSNRIFLYMYYEADCNVEGEQIMTYLQVISRADRNSQWEQNGTYKGIATVATLWAGGNKNDYRLTIDPATWIAVAVVSQ